MSARESSQTDRMTDRTRESKKSHGLGTNVPHREVAAAALLTASDAIIADVTEAEVSQDRPEKTDLQQSRLKSISVVSTEAS